MTVDVPSIDVEDRASIPLTVLTASSTRLVISVSISSAEEPGLEVEITTVGRSTLGDRSRPRVVKENAPTTIRARINMVAKTGRRTHSAASACMRLVPLSGELHALAVVEIFQMIQRHGHPFRDTRQDAHLTAVAFAHLHDRHASLAVPDEKHLGGIRGRIRDHSLLRHEDTDAASRQKNTRGGKHAGL